jgi:ribosomal protein S18 acetylase RimI-like enzyme
MDPVQPMSPMGGESGSRSAAASAASSASAHDLPDLPVRIRSYRPDDLPACRKLYVEGLLGGRLAENDTGLDIDDIDMAYMKTAGNHFWVAETTSDLPSDGAAGEIVGMIGVQHHEEGVGEIRRLRVRADVRRRGIGSKLIETALHFCQERSYLKITLDTFMEREPAIKLFEKFRFHHHRTKNVSGKDLMYFYLDLYSQEGRRPQS